MSESLYERLGGNAGVKALASDIVDLHIDNPIIGPRFVKIDADKLKRLLTEFIGSGTGGSETYTGRDMKTAHTGMNLSETELLSAIDDVMKACDSHGHGEQEKKDVLMILYSFKDDVLHV